jgi:hypothetical protein
VIEATGTIFDVIAPYFIWHYVSGDTSAPEASYSVGYGCDASTTIVTATLTITGPGGTQVINLLPTPPEYVAIGRIGAHTLTAEIIDGYGQKTTNVINHTRIMPVSLTVGTGLTQDSCAAYYPVTALPNYGAIQVLAPAAGPELNCKGAGAGWYVPSNYPYYPRCGDRNITLSGLVDGSTPGQHVDIQVGIWSDDASHGGLDVEHACTCQPHYDYVYHYWDGFPGYGPDENLHTDYESPSAQQYLWLRTLRWDVDTATWSIL